MIIHCHALRRENVDERILKEIPDFKGWHYVDASQLTLTMSIEEFVKKYSLEPVDKVKRIMPSWFWGDQSLDEVGFAAFAKWIPFR
jgi:hypothetical protein